MKRQNYRNEEQISGRQGLMREVEGERQAGTAIKGKT